VALEDLDTRAFATEDQLGFLARYAGDAALPVNLVYGGNDAMLRNGVPVQSWPTRLAWPSHLIQRRP
jgi:hypothetical protein